jgi:hypothetical protein
VTILESKEREKGSNNDSESSLERETEVGTEAETAFSFIRAVFSVRRMGGSVFLWEGGITVFKGITGMDRLCNKGPGQDDEG